jgi:hypothetical protein
MIPLLSIAILLSLATFAVAYSPKALRHLAVRLLGRAEGLEAYATAHQDGLKHWRAKFALGDPEPFDLTTIRKRLEGR